MIQNRLKRGWQGHCAQISRHRQSHHLIDRKMTDFMNKITRHMAKATDTSRYPLTSSQREVWFNQQRYPTSPLYNIGDHMNLPVSIDSELFRQAMNLLIRKHDSLHI